VVGDLLAAPEHDQHQGGSGRQTNRAGPGTPARGLIRHDHQSPSPDQQGIDRFCSPLGENAKEEMVKGQQAGQPNPEVSPRKKQAPQAPPLTGGANTAQGSQHRY
jgi:hypothetical protein